MKCSFVAGKIVGGKLFFSLGQFNSLFMYDFQTEDVEHIGFFRGEPKNRSNIHNKAFLYNEEIVFIPSAYSKHVHIYNMKNKTLHAIDIPVNSTGTYWVSDACIVDDFLWIMPGDLEQKIIKIDLKSGECVSLKPLNISLQAKTAQIFNKISLCEGVIYMPVTYGNQLVLYETTSGELIVKNLDIENMTASYCVNNKIYLCTCDGHVALYEDDKCSLCVIEGEESSSELVEYKVCEASGLVYLIPVFGENCWVGDGYNFRKCGTVSFSGISDSGVEHPHYGTDMYSGSVVVFPTPFDDMYIVDLNGKNIEKSVIYGGADIDEIYRNVKGDFSANCLVTESRCMTVFDYIDMIRA